MDKRKSKKRVKGYLLPKYQIEGRVIPTRQDSLDLLNSSLAVQNFYSQWPYIGDGIGRVGDDVFKEIEKNLNLKNQIFSKHIEKEGVYHLEDSNIDAKPIPPELLYQEIDKNKFKKRERLTGTVNTNAPMQLFDRRITPSYKGGAVNPFRWLTESGGDIVDYYTYDPLQVTPWDMLSEEDKKRRIVTYGTDGTPYAPKPKPESKKRPDISKGVAAAYDHIKKSKSIQEPVQEPNKQIKQRYSGVYLPDGTYISEQDIDPEVFREMRGKAKKASSSEEFEKSKKEYGGEIEKAQNGYKFPSEYLAKQAFVESTWDPKSYNVDSEAAGLTQFRPITVKDIKQRGFIDDSFDIYNPEDAIKAQIAYMNWLGQRPYIDKPNQTEDVRSAKTLLAYNRGPERAKKVLTDLKNRGIDIYSNLDWVDEIPDTDEEGRNYIKMILQGQSTEGRPKIQENYQKALVDPKYQYIRDIYAEQTKPRSYTRPYKEGQSLYLNLKDKFQNGGKVKEDYNLKRAEELGYTRDETGHLFSVDHETGMWLKSKEHPTAYKEYISMMLNPDVKAVINPEGYFGENQLQYISRKEDGGKVLAEQPIQQELPYQEVVSYPTERQPAADPRVLRFKSARDSYINLDNTPIPKTLSKKYNVWNNTYKSPKGLPINSYKDIYDIQEFFNSGDWKKGFELIEKYRKPSHPMLGEIDPETKVFTPSADNLNTNEEIADYIDINNIPVKFRTVERIPTTPEGFLNPEVQDKVILPGQGEIIPVTTEQMTEPIKVTGSDGKSKVLEPGIVEEFRTPVIEERIV